MQLLHQDYRIALLIAEHHVPPALVLNLDQFGLKILSLGDKTRAPIGAKSVPVIGADDKRQITGVPVVAADGTLVSLQLIWEGKTDRCHPKGEEKCDKIKHSHSVSHWSTFETMVELIARIDAYRLEVINRDKLSPLQKLVLIIDVWSVHVSKAFRELVRTKYPFILLNYIPPRCTSKGQVCDLVVNKKMKDFANDTTCNEVAQSVAAQLSAMRAAGEIRHVSIDIKLTVLKPVVCAGMRAGIEYFETGEGRELIKKGFLKAGVTRCFDTDFQRQAVAWVASNPQERAPSFESEEVTPPSAALHTLDAIAVAVDDEIVEVLEEGQI